MRIVGRGAIGLLLLMFASTAAAAADAKRVLIVNSFGPGTPPFTTHSTAFEATLAAEMGEAIDLDEVSLGMARYAQADIEEAFGQLLLKRLAKWQPDLVAPVGSPAGRFVAKYRDRLFPGTPVIYTGMDRRTLPPDLGGNATFVGENFDLPGLVEDILQLRPDTTNIVVVIGASPLERFWTTIFQREFARFSDRVTFTWLDRLPFEEMLRRVASLPPRSFILLALLVRDARGVTYNQDHALQRLRAAANAPINGLFQNQLGLGIVGGRLYQAEREGEESARVAIRILRGDPVSSYPPRIIEAQKPRYDWRELQRWNIPEDRLPPGSRVEFREPTVWQRHWLSIIGALAVGLVQAALIALLVLNLARRWRVERSLRESQERTILAATAADLGLWEWDVTRDQVWFTSAGRVQLGDLAPTNLGGFMRLVHPDDHAEVGRALTSAMSGAGDFECVHRIVLPHGEPLRVASIGRMEFDAGGRPLRLRGASRDITRSHQVELEVQRQRDELAHLARVAALGELSGSLAHELRQPLTAILMNARAAERVLGRAGSDPSEVRGILGDIVADDQRAAEIIQRLQHLFKKGEVRRQPTDVNELVRQVTKLAHGELVLTGVELETDLAPELPSIQGDDVQLQQVLLNLVANACHAMADGLAPRRCLSVRTAATGQGVHVTVSDRGPGIPAEDLERIFDPFVSSRPDGMGLGLAVCRTIVHAHGGALWAENDLESGARFHFTLPLAVDETGGQEYHSSRFLPPTVRRSVRPIVD